MAHTRERCSHTAGRRHGILWAGVLLAASVAQPALAQRPDFQAPFACGQVWDASTYEGHGPDPDSVDFIERNQNGVSLGQGQPVLASAAGTVVFDKTWGAGAKEGERWVLIDHGDGWRTHYFHNEDEPDKPRLKVGRRVAQGEIIGRTSNSGTTAVHQHYGQIRNATASAQTLATATWRTVMGNGEGVRVHLDGAAINTHQGNESSWGTWNDPDAEEIRSHNCSGNAFARWVSGGNNYILRYNPQSGMVRINQMHVSNSNNPQTHKIKWGMNWNTIMPFYAGGNSQPHVLLYNFANGELAFRRIHPDHKGTTFLKKYTVYAGWTHMVPVTFDGKPHFLSYDSRYGFLNIDRINQTSSGFSAMTKTKIGKGYTHLVPYEEGPRRYLLLYGGGSGKMEIIRLKPRAQSGGEAIDVESVWSDNRRRNWSHLAPMPRDGKRYMFGYDAADGTAKIWLIRTNGRGLEHVKNLGWSTGYSSITPYSNGSTGHLLVQKIASGATKKLRLKRNLSGFRELTSTNWTAGFR